jgi:hypothetical protein
MRMYSASGRSRWPLVIIGGVAAIAIVGGVAYGAVNQDEPVAAPTTQPTPTPSATDTSGAGDGEEGAAPTGCLGGNNRDADMVLTAQAEAPHTTFGAVEVATSFYRFLWQYPYPSETEAAAVMETVISSTVDEKFGDLPELYRSAGDNPTGGVVTPGTPFYTSSTNGIWRVSEDSTPDRVVVDLAVGYVIDGALSPTAVAGMGVVMVWEPNGWRVDGSLFADQDKLAAGGTRYTGGC